jgi:hypothetical protein
VMATPAHPLDEGMSPQAALPSAKAGRGRGRGGRRVARRDLRMFANGTFINPLEMRREERTRISSQTLGVRRRQERNGLSFVDATHAKRSASKLLEKTR